MLTKPIEGAESAREEHVEIISLYRKQSVKDIQEVCDYVQFEKDKSWRIISVKAKK